MVLLSLAIVGCGGSGSSGPGPTPNPTAFLGLERTRQVGPVNYSYYQFGQGQPLVLINAFGMTNANWTTTLLRELGKRYRVTIFDNRGIGRSVDTSPDQLTIDTMADSTVALIEALGIHKPDILSWSMGAETALTIGLRHSNKVGKLILVGSDAGGPNTLPPTPEFMAIAVLADPTIAQVMSIIFPPGHQAAIDRYLEGWHEMPVDLALPDQRNVQLGAFAIWQTQGVWEQLPTIQNPTLVLHGAEDISTPIENAQGIANRMPNATLVQFPNAGHAVLFQEQETCLTIMDIFLKE